MHKGGRGRDTTDGPKFGLSSIVGPHIGSNTENYGIHCLRPEDHPDFLSDEGMSLPQSAAGDCSCNRDPMSIALSPFTTRRGVVNPQSTWGSKEDIIAKSSDDGSSKFHPLTSPTGLPVSIVGEKSTCMCPCCGRPQQSQIENSIKEFENGQKGPSEGVDVYYERLITTLAELGVTISRHVRVKSSGEREVFIAKLLSRDYYTMVPSLSNGLEELDMEK